MIKPAGILSLGQTEIGAFFKTANKAGGLCTSLDGT